MRYRETFTFPFQAKIPGLVNEFIDKEKGLWSFVKFFKRSLILFFFRQSGLEKDAIRDVKKILWINLSAPSLGDSLMDLSSRVLLNDCHLSLFTSLDNAHIFYDDEFFSEVFVKESEIKYQNFDFIILDSYSSRTLRIKNKYFRKKKFTSMFGFFNGPEVNRVLFSFYRMNHLLRNRYSADSISNLARCHMTIGTKDKQIIEAMSLPESFITIAIGGEWAYRTYKKWREVIDLIIDFNIKQKIALVGSSNALEIGKEIMDANKHRDNLIYLVDKLSFKQTSAVISKSSFIICCDGGLMHAAHAVGTASISLIARLTPEMQLTNAIESSYLYDPENVNNIHCLDIFNKYKTLIAPVN